MRDRHHRRHLSLPALVHRVARHLGDGAIVIVAIDDVEEVETIPENLPPRDADAAHTGEDLRPDGGVGRVVTRLGPRLQPGMQSDGHHGSVPRVVRNQRSPVAT